MARILAIEDEQELIKAYALCFPADEVVEADANSSESLRGAIETADIVISDFYMPVLQFQQIRELCERLCKPLVLVTGEITPIYRHQTTKPFTRQQLRQTAQRAVTEMEERKHSLKAAA
ncbi:MAG: hypothetical protein HYW49_01975 [Deltaproteobacteria bacterium]|nr:hypothetical protein [Deltaproteobacteria bacterium]